MLRRSGINAFEVIVLIVIIGVLAAMLLPAVSSMRHVQVNSREMSKVDRSAGSVATSADDAPVPLFSTMGDVDDSPSLNKVQNGETLGSAREETGQVAAKASRRIVYDSQLSLVVEDISKTETELTKLAKEADGYVAEEAVDKAEGERVTGHWRLRIPVDKFDTFVEAAGKLGIVENRRQTSQDVTEQYVDLEAQIANKKKLEERILQLLDNKAGQLKDVITVEQELARVRTEIERMEGRLRLLTNRSELATVSISARVERNYVPEKSPDLEKRVETAWEASLEKLRVFGEQVLVAGVYAGPWIGVAIVLLVPAFVYVKMRTRRA